MTAALELALEFAERWPWMLEALKGFATWNDAGTDSPKMSEHFVGVLQSLNGQLKDHSLTIVSSRQRLTSVAPQTLNIRNSEYQHATDASLSLANDFVMTIWNAVDLLAACRAACGDKTAHFDPVTAGTPEHWQACREAVANFFDGGWWQAGTLRKLTLAVERERFALFPPNDNPAGGGRGEAVGNQVKQKLRDCDLKAGRQYDEAMKHADGMGLELKTYEAAYCHYCDHLKDNGERMIQLGSWKKFASNYLKADGRPKYTKGAGVETRSVVRSKSKNRTKTDRL